MKFSYTAVFTIKGLILDPTKGEKLLIVDQPAGLRAILNSELTESECAVEELKLARQKEFGNRLPSNGHRHSTEQLTGSFCNPFTTKFKRSESLQRDALSGGGDRNAHASIKLCRLAPWPSLRAPMPAPVRNAPWARTSCPLPCCRR